MWFVVCGVWLSLVFLSQMFTESVRWGIALHGAILFWGGGNRRCLWSLSTWLILFLKPFNMVIGPIGRGGFSFSNNRPGLSASSTGSILFLQPFDLVITPLRPGRFSFRTNQPSHSASSTGSIFFSEPIDMVILSLRLGQFFFRINRHGHSPSLTRPVLLFCGQTEKSSGSLVLLYPVINRWSPMRLLRMPVRPHVQ